VTGSFKGKRASLDQQKTETLVKRKTGYPRMDAGRWVLWWAKLCKSNGPKPPWSAQRLLAQNKE